jgi:peptide-N4-(N-acetyl-beta-glucosaminyl)asparagine amidase
VWAEVLLEGAWVHLDPCEAAVDQPLLYESWGKKPTFVLAHTHDGIEDVTHRYCADARDVIGERRLKEGVTQELFEELLFARDGAARK